MASGWCQAMEKSVLDQVFGNQTAFAQGTWYLGLCTGGCVDAGTISGEPTGNNYSRVTITNNNTNFPNCTTDGSKTNGAAFTFPECQTATWGLITTFFFSTVSSGGTAAAWGDLGTSKTINPGDTPKFNTGDMTLTLD